MRDGSHLEALVEDAALALDAHVLGPLDEPVQVALGGQRTADTEGLGAALEEGVGGSLLRGISLLERRGRRLLTLGSLGGGRERGGNQGGDNGGVDK
jgi:hypothetical protein